MEGGGAFFVRFVSQRRFLTSFAVAVGMIYTESVREGKRKMSDWEDPDMEPAHKQPRLEDDSEDEDDEGDEDDEDDDEEDDEDDDEEEVCSFRFVPFSCRFTSAARSRS